MGKRARVSRFIRLLGELSQEMPDKRAGRHNQIYEMSDAVRGAFSVFYMQSASFLEHQRIIAQRQGRSNLESVFQMGQIPSDNHIRDLLDGVPAPYFELAYEWLWQQLLSEGRLSGFEALGGRLLVGLDGIQFFSSTKIHCEQCSQQTVDGRTRYHHRALTALVVHPGQAEVLPLPPEFLLPQDGTDKQDSELAAAKRWLPRHAAWLQQQQALILGDDLFSHQPFCELVLSLGLDFILVCKPSSHETLYEWLAGMERGGKVPEINRRVWNGRHGEIWRYRYVNDLPLRAGDDGLRVNWCELTVSHETTGERLYYNTFVTSLLLGDHQVKEVTHAGRARWKHENEGHNVLTTRGYHIKHNFGHGHQHLATVMFTLNLLAFFLHTFLHLVDTTYRRIREALGARRTFFEDARSLMRWQLFDSWEALIQFMAEGMELEPAPD
jgi:hypothetical protein